MQRRLLCLPCQTDFHCIAEYESDMAFLQQCTQDELVQLLRSDGRRQAAQRMLKQKRDGAAAYHAADSDDE